MHVKLKKEKTQTNSERARLQLGRGKNSLQREQHGSKNGSGREHPFQGNMLSGVSSAPAGERREEREGKEKRFWKS